MNVFKILFQKTFPQATWWMGPNTVVIWTATPLPYLFITVNILQLEKVYFSAMQNLETIC